MNYDYDFKKTSEEVLKEVNNVNVSFNEKNYECNIIKTNKKLLFFVDDNKTNMLKNPSITLLAANKLIHAIDIVDLKYTISDGNTIIDFEGNEIIIYGFILD